MTSTHATISIIYDEEQDRLRLLLTSKEQHQVEGIMTRRLLKGVLKGVPNWLEKQVTIPIVQSEQNKPTQAQQHAVNQFQHQAAQLQSSEKIDIQFNETVTHFMIETLNLSSVKQRDGSPLIEMRFISKDQKNNINLSLTIEQFHKLLGAMIDKASSWDLVNPWLDDMGTVTSTVIPDAGVMH